MGVRFVIDTELQRELEMRQEAVSRLIKGIADHPEASRGLARSAALHARRVAETLQIVSGRK